MLQAHLLLVPINKLTSHFFRNIFRSLFKQITNLPVRDVPETQCNHACGEGAFPEVSFEHQKSDLGVGGVSRLHRESSQEEGVSIERQLNGGKCFVDVRMVCYKAGSPWLWFPSRTQPLAPTPAWKWLACGLLHCWWTECWMRSRLKLLCCTSVSALVPCCPLLV